MGGDEWSAELEVEAEGGRPSRTAWSLVRVTPVSKHSAIFGFESKDRKRGTPHPRGNGRLPQPATWHTTLLAEVGRNGEGPLPWVERDYTPISTGAHSPAPPRARRAGRGVA